ncbi:hypothetical protein GCM10008935_14140 [Alkalibacillus silvisoli]|uniref:Uncharacterized protein n=1 Tax=Alkalibacillus silvisoli TaxID=392823 RepID=A0ABN0ZVQ4_9BACI
MFVFKYGFWNYNNKKPSNIQKPEFGENLFEFYLLDKELSKTLNQQNIYF